VITSESPRRPVTITSKLVGTVTVLHVSDRALTASEGNTGLRHEVRHAIDSGTHTIVLNLQDVADIDSSGVADLASGHLTLASGGRSLKLCHLSKKLKHIFAITRLSNVFEIYETEADAIASVKST